MLASTFFGAPYHSIYGDCRASFPPASPKGGKLIQMEDEIGSMAAIIGASLASGKAMTATSGPGYSLMQEAIGSPSWQRSLA